MTLSLFRMFKKVRDLGNEKEELARMFQDSEFEVKEAKRTVEKAKKELVEREDIVATLNEEVDRCAKSLGVSRDKLGGDGGKAAKAAEATAAAMDKLTDELNMLLQEKKVMKDEKFDNEKQEREAKTQADDEEEKLTAAKAELSKKEIAMLSKLGGGSSDRIEVETQREALNKAEAELADAKSITSRARVQMEEMNNELAAGQRQLLMLSQANKESSNSADDLRQRKQDLNKEYQQAQSQLTAMKKDPNGETKKQIEGLPAELVVLKQKLLDEKSARAKQQRRQTQELKKVVEQFETEQRKKEHSDQNQSLLARVAEEGGDLATFNKELHALQKETWQMQIKTTEFKSANGGKEELQALNQDLVLSQRAIMTLNEDLKAMQPTVDRLQQELFDINALLKA